MNIVDKLKYEELFEFDKEKAQQKFCVFGEEKWKQVIDGKYHKYGKMVFDEGLHGKEKEPGYYASACKALDFAKDHLCEPVTVQFYKDLHKIACAHFKKENNTIMNASDSGKFRQKDNCTNAKFLLSDIIDFYNRSEPLKDEVIEGFNTILDVFPIENEAQVTLKSISNLRRMTNLKDKLESIDFQTYTRLEKTVKTNLQNFKQQICDLKENIILSEVIPSINSYGKWLKISYSDRNDFDDIISKIFHIFNKKMCALNKEKKYMEKLELIADLFQKLELIHPFPDGQGRTDLILLSKLLSEQGFNPPILEEPYVSSYVPLKPWVQYLQEGIETGQKLTS